MSTTDEDKEFYSSWKNVRKFRRQMFGVACPKCPSNRNATILLPQQRCKVDGYKDPRPRLTKEQEEMPWKAAGFTPVKATEGKGE